MNAQIVIIDFGSQYTHLILRNIRSLSLYCQIEFPDEAFFKHDFSKLRGLILSGGPRTITPSEIDFTQKLLDHYPNTPLLGICYGMQLLGKIFGEEVHSAIRSEYGPEKLILQKQNHPFFKHISKKTFKAWMSHGDHVELRPKSKSRILALSSQSTIAALEFKKHVLGVQFHPEVTHTQFGKHMLGNFLDHYAKAKRDWQSDQIFKDIEAEVHTTIIRPKHTVLCAISGGVDSTVLGMILQKECPNQTHFIHVDHGLGRHHESDQVIQHLTALGIPVKRINAQERFITTLEGVSDPEQKRKIIGAQFIRVFEEYARNHGITHLVQGTLYPDIIESRSHVGKSDVIKTHHNVGGIPKDCALIVIDPFCHLYKDDVRALGKKLSIPHDLLYRHPFPGAGLAIRILGEVTEERLDILRRCDHILIEFLKTHKLYDKIWQSACVFLPIKSVGVKGDKRAYLPVVAIRCVSSTNAMTAHAYRFSMQTLEACATRILNQVHEVGRVVYDISPKPPATIEWE